MIFFDNIKSFINNTKIICIAAREINSFKENYISINTLIFINKISSKPYIRICNYKSIKKIEKVVEIILKFGKNNII